MKLKYGIEVRTEPEPCLLISNLMRSAIQQITELSNEGWGTGKHKLITMISIRLGLHGIVITRKGYIAMVQDARQNPFIFRWKFQIRTKVWSALPPYWSYKERLNTQLELNRFRDFYAPIGEILCVRSLVIRNLVNSRWKPRNLELWLRRTIWGSALG